MYDQADISNINALVGEYLASRDKGLFNYLKLGMIDRKQRLSSAKNHAKVVLLTDDTNYYVVEGSANFTANPRIEQFVLTNHKELFNFHKEWMNLLLTKSSISGN